MQEISKAIYNTIAYAAIFSYPLTKEEIYRYLIADTAISKSLINRLLKKQTNIEEKEGYYYLKGSSYLVALRKKREKISLQKIVLAKRVASILSILPSIELIGISGGLSMNNTDLDDDIDLFIITREKTLWISRLIVLFVLTMLGKRRFYKTSQVANKICTNMFLSLEDLILPKVFHNLYGAHEVLQMRPLLIKTNTYRSYLTQNEWVKNFLPNEYSLKIKKEYSKQNSKTNIFSSFTIKILILLERPSKWLQMQSIKQRRTSEIITDTVLAFHPGNYREKILQKYHELRLD